MSEHSSQLTRIDSTIFKSYDVRGVYPETLNAEIAERIGAATVDFLGAKKMGVGRDMRESSVPLYEGLVRGIISRGCEVIDFGLISTDMLYFGVGSQNLDGGIMITASHNPGKDNGLKICREKAKPIGMGTGLEKIRDAVLNPKPAMNRPMGKIHLMDLMPSYREKCLSFIQPQKLKPFKLVVDAGNGMGGKTWPGIQSGLPCKTIPLFFELDGTFPNHVPNPLIPENLELLQKEVLARKADMGIAFDGDADRCVLVDELGVAVSGSEITALVAQYLLSNPANKGKTVLYDLRCSKMVPETILANGGVPAVTRVGHSHIKQRMAEDALFAGELSGHYYFQENYNADSGMMAALIMLQIISLENKSLSQIVAPLRNKWHHSGEINFMVQNKEQKINELKQLYGAQGKIMELDGLTIDLGNWWFNVRASNTEPFLRLNVEADNAKLLNGKKTELEQLLSR